MTQRIWVLFQHRIPPFNHQQLRPSAGMSRLDAALAANLLSPVSPRLKAQSERIASQVVSALDSNTIQATFKVSAGIKFAVGCLAP